MVDRAKRGGGVARPLTGPQASGSQAVVQYQAGGSGADWFGPSQPLPPMAPPEVEGRTWDFPSNYNLQTGKRPFEPIKFDALKAFADSWDVLRTIIETRKDQMARQRPRVVPKDPKAKVDGDGADPILAAQIERATALIDEPYPGIEWADWLRRLLEDLFVLDAPAIYVRKTVGGDVYGLKPIDGGTISRVLDPWGDTPAPPNAAYVQYLKGVGAVHYTTERLIYRPRNPRNGRAFGFSPVEQIIILVNLALRRETWQLNYFTEGNMPDALIGVPMEWTPDQIRNFQDWFDARLAGDLGKRRGATFVPGDVAKGYVATKETELFGKAEEWLARVACFAFSISPQPFTQMMNRATAGTAQEQAAEEGLEPIKDWVSGLWSLIFKRIGLDKIKLGWEEEEDTDPKTQAETQNILVTAGIKTRNQARRVLGEDPDPSPEANMLMVTLATGLVPVSFDDALDQQKKKQDLLPPPAVPGDGNPPAGGKEPDAPKPQGGGGGAGGSRLGGGGGGAAGARRRPAGKGAVPAAPGVRKLDPIPFDRPATRRARAAIKRGLKPLLATLADEVAAQVEHALMKASKARKADDPEQKDGQGAGITAVAALALTDAEIADLVANLDLSSLDVLVNVTEPALEALAKDAGLKALAQLGLSDETQLVDRVNEAAVEFARERSAELVGKRYTASGELIDNPSPLYAITETTRNDLRGLITRGLEDNIGTPAIAESIQGAFTFSEARAELIAFTEVANANGQGKLGGWRVASDEGGVKLLKSWQTSNDEDEVCDECLENEDQGPIPLEDNFPSGDDAEPAHPRCFAPSTLVEGAFVAGAKSLYEGPMREIVTRSGARLTVTPNHPIFSARGLIPAAALKVGDHAIRYSPAVKEPIAPGTAAYDYHAPSSVEQVFHTMRLAGPGRWVKAASDDLHGDAMFAKGNIEVVWAKGHLLNDVETAPAELGGEGGLVGANELEADLMGGGPSVHGVAGLGCAPLRVVGRPDKPLALLRGRLGHAQGVRLPAAAGLDAALRQAAAEHNPLESSLKAEGLLGLTGEVSLDEVVEVRDFQSSGHVYDLQSTTGWLIADGLLASNCQCVTYVEVDDSANSEGGDEADD